MNQKSLRVGLVGCGGHGTNLAQAVARTEGLQLVACADPDSAAARRAAMAGVAAGVHDSIESVLRSADVDAVLVATPHHLLTPVALAAIRSRKHVMVDKPMALDEAQGREVEFAAASAGVSCMAGYSFRFLMGKYLHDLVVA